MTIGRRAFIYSASLALLLPAQVLAQQNPDPELREILRKAASDADSFEDRFDAEVWLTDMSARLARQVRDPDERIRILTRVHYEASRAELAPELVLALIEVESNFDTYAVSRGRRFGAHASHAVLDKGNRPAG